MPELDRICGWSGDASALVGSGAEVDGEGDFFVRDEVPAEAVEGVAFDAGDADTLPTEALCVPGFAGGAQGEDGVEAGEEDEVVFGDCADIDDGFERDVSGGLGGEGVDDVRVASGDGAEFVGVRAGVDAGGHAEVGEAESAGGEELASSGGADEELKRASGEGVFFAGDLARVGELACRGDEGRGF